MWWLVVTICVKILIKDMNQLNDSQFIALLLDKIIAIPTSAAQLKAGPIEILTNESKAGKKPPIAVRLLSILFSNHLLK